MQKTAGPTSTSSGQDRVPRGQCPRACCGLGHSGTSKWVPRPEGTAASGATWPHRGKRAAGLLGSDPEAPLAQDRWTEGLPVASKGPLAPAACLPPAHTAFICSLKHHIRHTLASQRGCEPGEPLVPEQVSMVLEAPRFHGSGFKKAFRLPLRELTCSPTV